MCATPPYSGSLTQNGGGSAQQRTNECTVFMTSFDLFVHALMHIKSEKGKDSATQDVRCNKNRFVVHTDNLKPPIREGTTN